MLRVVVGTLSVMFLLAIPVPWLIGMAFAMTVSSKEFVTIRDTGMVTCPEVLHWSEWRPGTGQLSRSHIYERIDKDAEIVEYRIGRDAKSFAELTFYQAKYRSPDGTVAIAPADGPQPTVSVDETLALTCSAASAALCMLSFWLMSRFPAIEPSSLQQLA